MAWIFWISLFLLMSNYVLYPLLLWVLSHFVKIPHPTADTALPVSFVIAAYNESAVIARKLSNTLALDYPQGKLEIIVVTDGSTDETPRIVESFGPRGVRLLHLPERRGKTAAVNRAVAQASNEIVVFSDANNFFEPDALRKLSRHFHDRRVGGVCGLKSIQPSPGRASSTGDGIFWKYESFLKKIESALGSIAGADGEIFAVRRALYRQVDQRVINDDQVITIDLVRQGYRVVYDIEAKSTEYASITLADDYHVKVRMVAGGFQTMHLYGRYLFNFLHGFPLQFFFHKVIRWLVPHFLVLLFTASVFLFRRGSEYQWALLLQVAFYGAGMAGLLLHVNKREIKLLYMPFYFCYMNIAAFMGLLAFFRLGSRPSTAVWRKARR